MELVDFINEFIFRFDACEIQDRKIVMRLLIDIFNRHLIQEDL